MILILTGLARSGKTFASKYLESKGFTKLTFSDILVEECKKRGLEPTKMNLSKLGDTLRSELGMGALGKIIVEKIKGENVVLDGSRSPEEIYEIKKKFPNAKVIFVDASKDVRFSRRNEHDPQTREEFFKRDKIDIKNKGVSKVIDTANITVENNGSVVEFEKKLDGIVRNLSDEEKYASMGVKIGVEIHQRLDTHKLFCSCSSEQKESPIMNVMRFLHTARGEMGSTDRAAMFEVEKNNKFVYYVYPGETCLVELDEEPPHGMNEEALKTTIQFCKLVGADVVDEIHVMRKIVVDGSDTTGFQRTALVGMNGNILSSLGKVRVSTICLEEEAARIDKKTDDVVYYKLNGLGIPLIEVATAPDIKTPKHTREVCEKIGRLLRSLKVQRGIGSIRQDINISVSGGVRVEIKGFQNLNDMEKVIESEITRQRELIKIKNELNERKIENISDGRIFDVTDLFSNCKTKFLRSLIDKGERIYASKLIGLRGFLKRDVGGHTLGKELAYYAMVLGPKGIIHNDEDLSKYGLEREFSELSKILDASKNDIMFIVAGSKSAAKAVIERAKLLPVRVPEETRAVNGTNTKYMRPLPGKHRMYPETDILPIDSSNFVGVEAPKTLDEYEKELSFLGNELAKPLVRSKDFRRFLELSKKVDDKKLLAILFVNIFKDLGRDGYDVSRISDDDIVRVLNLVSNGKISKSALRDVFASVSHGERDIEKFMALSDDEIRKLVEERASLGDKKKIIGDIMRNYRTLIDGSKLSKIVDEVLR